VVGSFGADKSSDFFVDLAELLLVSEFLVFGQEGLQLFALAGVQEL
jgi:hypothetical protein